mgnify:CR=1 FL=1
MALFCTDITYMVYQIIEALWTCEYIAVVGVILLRVRVWFWGQTGFHTEDWVMTMVLWELEGAEKTLKSNIEYEDDTPLNDIQLTHTQPLPIILVKGTVVQSTGTNNIGRD